MIQFTTQQKEEIGDAIKVMAIKVALNNHNLLTLIHYLDDRDFILQALQAYFEENGIADDLDWVYSCYNEKTVSI